MTETGLIYLFAAPYGCNDKIDSVGNLTSPRCSSVNVRRLFGSSQTKRSHGHRHYNRPNFHADVTFDTLLPYVQQPVGLHHIRTKLYQLPVTKLRSLQKEVVDTKTYIQNSPEYKLVAIILGVVKFRLTSLLKEFLQKRLPLVIFWNLTSETRVLTPLTLAISWTIRKWLQPYQLTSKTRAHLKFSITQTCCKS